MIHVPKATAIFSQSNSKMGRLTRWGSTSRGEAPTLTNHSMACSIAGTWPAASTYFEPMVIESQKTVVEGPLSERHAKDKFSMYDIEMTPDERDRVVRYARSRLGRVYGASQLLPQLFDNKILGGRVFLRRLWKLSPLDICSRLLDESMEQVGIKLSPQGKVGTPDDQEDALRLCFLGGMKLDGRTVTCLLDQIGDLK